MDSISDGKNWSEVLAEISEVAHPLDLVRRKYLKKVSEITERNVILYYSGWLHKNHESVSIHDIDKNGFMQAIHKMDRRKGLDLILHTPGGDLGATESIVTYLDMMFDGDLRAIIPQLAMSAGTMLSFCTKEIVMGKHSDLEPIDPQLGGVACQNVLDEFEQAKEEVRENPSSTALWQVIISKYHPTFLKQCEHAVKWGKELAEKWLGLNMLNPAIDQSAIHTIVDTFSDHSQQKTHGRHISRQECKDLGLKVTDLENNQDLQDAVLKTHHACMHTFANSDSVKIIENHKGVAFILQGNTPQ